MVYTLEGLIWPSTGTHVVVSDIPLPSFNGVEAQIHQFVLEAVFKATLANEYIFIYRGYASSQSWKTAESLQT
ncbi:hypothetical protein D9758_008965 [Tetrapyrgos nigripes]|uniref:Uncharacterized protein n=1 Tax=Tetrapyrgos nigripes TaxID=182062 RepID=A0A8H5GK46_9AGAR|nr:hypothetical protein D9758_008965 [Tetrapyrgos nigripes]